MSYDYFGLKFSEIRAMTKPNFFRYDSQIEHEKIPYPLNSFNNQDILKFSKILNIKFNFFIFFCVFLIKVFRHHFKQEGSAACATPWEWLSHFSASLRSRDTLPPWGRGGGICQYCFSILILNNGVFFKFIRLNFILVFKKFQYRF